VNVKHLALGTAFALGTLIGFAAESNAVPITGTISMTGALTPRDGGAGGGATNNFNAADFLDFSPAGGGTGSFFVNVANGDLAGFVGSLGSIKDFSFDPFAAVDDFYTVTAAPGTLTFDLNSLTIDTRGATFLSLSGDGTLSLTGFDDTSGHWTFSTQSTGGTVEFTWSSSTVAVPEPATLALIGAGLASAGLLRRRKTA
jgi:hypothetical protein